MNNPNVSYAHRPVFTQRNFFSILTCAAALLAAAARGQQVDPVPWMGEAGITETVDQIMARDGMFPPPAVPRVTGKPQRINRDRTGLPQDPNSPAIAAYPPLPAGVSPVAPAAYGARSPQVLGTSFTGVTLSEAGFIPPDTMGDVSPTQILFEENGRVKLFDKNGALGALNTTSDTFFNSVRNASTVSDPVVRYDRITDRWFIVTINTTTPNRIMLAVSSAGPITGAASFTFFQFQQDLVGTTPNTDTGNFADYCTLGVDVNALYIGCRMFNPNFYNTTGWVVRKTSVTSGGPIVVTPFRNLLSGGAGPDGPRGVNNDDSTATQGYFIGQDVNVFGRLVLRRVSTPGGTPTMSANINLTVPTTSVPANVPAQGSTTALEAVDDRLFAAAIRKNRLTGTSTLWTAHAILTNSSGVASGTGDRDAMRWYQIQNFSATPSLLQSGTLFDNAASTPRYYWMGSINMSGQGHAALGASFAATDEFIGSATAGRLSGDTLGTIQAPSVIITGAAAYNQIAGGRNRWGDYSHTAVDPSDDMTMWTFQEYCNSSNSWAVRVTKLLAPPPATPASCSPASVLVGSSNVNITLTGTVVSGSGFFDPGATFPNHISSSVSGTGVTVNSTTWVSATSATLNITVDAAAAATARTITVTNPDGQAMTSATGILTITCTLPGVTTNPSALTRCTGTSASFTAAGTGSPTFQWRRNGSNIGGATSATYNIASVSAGDAGTYDCVLTNSCGSVNTTGALLTVNSAPAIFPNPSSISRCVGSGAAFASGASGSPSPTFQWQKNGADIPGATSSTYSIASVGAGDAGTYHCIATNSCGSATSSDAMLVVNTLPAVTTDPSSLSRCTGLGASFSVAGSGSPAPTLQWRHDGVNIAGATSGTYSIASVSGADAGNYDCVLTNTCGSATSAAAVLTVQTAPVVTTDPTALTRCTGASAMFTVAGTGTPAPTYQWRRNSVAIGGATADTLNIGAVGASDAGTYDCVLTNACGSATSGGALLTINQGPGITMQPTSLERCPGTGAAFTCAASGTPSPTFQWQRNGVDVPGATLATFSIASVAAGDAGTYHCIVTNSCGSIATSDASLAVDSAPVVTNDPMSIARCIGLGSSMSVSGTGSPAPALQWRHGGVDIPGATSGTYSIASVSAGDAGTYDCVLTNTCGSVTSAGAVLTVQTAPQVTTDPMSASRCAGLGVTFTAAGSGNPVPTFQWQLNGTDIAGATSGSLTIASVGPGDAGAYQCILTNPCGVVGTASAVLAVDSAPAITTDPAALALCVGDSAEFSVTASGTEPLSYQWRVGGADIAGATSSIFDIASVLQSDSGNYDCVVTNLCGSATSAGATLDVQPCCPADFNNDGGIDGADVDAFFAAWSAGDSSADVNRDGGVDGADVGTFFMFWEAGGC